jgi:hypothetical protein
MKLTVKAPRINTAWVRRLEALGYTVTLIIGGN